MPFLEELVHQLLAVEFQEGLPTCHVGDPETSGLRFMSYVGMHLCTIAKERAEHLPVSGLWLAQWAHLTCIKFSLCV